MTGGKCSDLVRAVLRSHESPDQSFNDLKIFIDFEQALPDEAQLQLFNLLEKLLKNAEEALEDLNNYQAGASTEIRLSIQNPNDQGLQEKYFAIVKECVGRLHSYYTLSQRIEQSVPLLLWELCSGPLPPAEQIDSCQALCKQLARLIDFSLQFDSVKMKTPSLQNDFSYYRRVVSRSAQPLDSDMISLETTNIMSLFIAKSTPMLCSITSSVIAFVQTHPDLPVSNTTDTLATVVHVCRLMVEREENWRRLCEKSRLFWLRVMVGAVILFDHIDDGGAFRADSPIGMKSVVELIRADAPEAERENLLNALRYTTKHLNDTITPKSIRSLFV
ncbi:hypothetical protein QR680_000059 [Steinernema hermaphroditum]|uniref:CYRIA/CYRIB Rac1 binding domain-containing protein n=1 Tax=Steinernema hermaphroditum TaxID=289476 RepID=A0AA39LDF5_9BILA|nr:hypothetical protein QR680_000059 [Steinernema hermaphroditum]